MAASSIATSKTAQPDSASLSIPILNDELTEKVRPIKSSKSVICPRVQYFDEEIRSKIPPLMKGVCDVFFRFVGAFSSEGLSPIWIAGRAAVRRCKKTQRQTPDPPFRFNRNGKGSQVAPLMTRRERNAKDPEARDFGKPLGCFRRHQRQDRRRNFATNHSIERFHLPFVELDFGRSGCGDRGSN